MLIHVFHLLFPFHHNSDPLTQFTVVISALIHDADHVGIPNFLLNDENKRLAKTYKGKSVAEQNSVDIAWEQLMDSRFDDLRNCIYVDTDELQRFRQLFVNTVLATDIFDKELSAQRKARWAMAFHEEESSKNTQEAKNRKATIVIEHLIQASDVAHTMQHWHIYTKWNERLFAEMYGAYKAGRSTKDPSDGWYQGEIGFFDGYVIPVSTSCNLPFLKKATILIYFAPFSPPLSHTACQEAEGLWSVWC